MAYYYHATTPENAESIISDGVLKANAFGEVFVCKKPLDCCKFLLIRGVRNIAVIELELEENEVEESHDHSESFFRCKAYIHRGDIELCGLETVTGYEFTPSEREEGEP